MTVDSTPPGVPPQPSLDPASDTGDSDGVTADTTPTLTGTADANVTVLVSSDLDGQLGTTTADGSGAWQLTPAGAMSEGAHAITAAARDAAGNTSGTSSSLAVTINTTAPAAPALEPASDTGMSDSDAVTQDQTPTVTGTTEPNVEVTVHSDPGGDLGTVTADGNGQWQFTPSGALAEGTHQVTITVTDGAGQSSPSSAALTVTIDVTPPDAPSAPALDPALHGSGSGTTLDSTPALVGTAEPNVQVAVTSDVDGPLGTTQSDSNGDWQLTSSADMTIGEHTLTAQATDPAGNAGATSEPGVIEVTAQRESVAVPAVQGLALWLLIAGVVLMALAHRRRFI